jgi:hypothetical protein
MTTRSTNHDWLGQTVEDPARARSADLRSASSSLGPSARPVAPRYLLDEILDDIAGGHNVVSTVFIECGAMFKPDGPEALRPSARPSS